MAEFLDWRCAFIERFGKTIMRRSLGNGITKLAAGRPMAFRGARGAEVKCTEGVVWLTLEGRPDDYFLSKGERLRIDSDGLALVEGNPSGAIRLVSAAPWSIRRAVMRAQRRIAIWETP